MAEEKLPVEQEEEYAPDLVTLEDESGEEHVFEVLDTIEHNDARYMALVPYIEDEEDLDEELSLILMKVGEDDDGEYLDIVEDDEELYEVGKVFEARLSELFDIEQ